MSEDKRSALQSLLEEMKTAVKDKNVDEINRLEDEINKIWNEVASAMYASQATAEPNTTEEVKNDDNIQNADFEEVK
jgi:hypothetical protein